MRVLVHDFSGHPFQAELARALALQGHDVLHVQFEGYVSGKGSFEPDALVPHLAFEAISFGEPFERYRFRRRIVQEIRYGMRFNRAAKAFHPDVIISCNDPLVAKLIFGLWAALRRIPWVFWLQDLYSIAMAKQAEKHSALGRAVGRVFMAIERGLLRSADQVVEITEDFDETLDEWRIDRAKRTVIENWAPLDELPMRPRDNPWRAEQGFGDEFLFLYSGTLGLKHNPDLLYELALADPTSTVVVISEGLGAEALRSRAAKDPLPNFVLLPFQPYERVPDVQGAADVLIVILESDAGRFAVPSKTLTYLCAGRPIVAAVPAENLAARTVLRAEAGIVADPSELDAVKHACALLRTDQGMRERMGANARSYAEKTFDVTSVTSRFAEVIERAVMSPSRRSTADAARSRHRSRRVHRGASRR